MAKRSVQRTDNPSKNKAMTRGRGKGIRKAVFPKVEFLKDFRYESESEEEDGVVSIGAFLAFYVVFAPLEYIPRIP